MQLGCHGLVWTGSFDEAGFDLAVAETKQAGYDLLEFPLMDPYSFDVAAAKRSLARNPIAITSSLGLPAYADISTAEPEKVQAGEDFLNRCVEVLSELGSHYLVGAIFSQLTKYMAPATDDGRKASQDVLNKVADRARGLGIQLGLEVVNRYETNLFNTGRGALAFIEEIGNDNIGVHLDTYHMNIEEPDMYRPVLETRAKLMYVHIGESHRGYLGSGSVDFDGFYRALAEIGYDGPMVFESFSSSVVSAELSNNLGIWRNLWDDSRDLARHAHAFMAGQLRAVETIELH